MRSQLLAMMGGIRNARWQSDDQLHLTLRFIGEVDRHQADDIAAALTGVDRPRPTIALSGVGAFDRKGMVHTLWAGVASNAALKTLHDRANRALQQAGVPPEDRAFAPHITVARLSRDAGPVEPFLARGAGLASEPVEVDAFILFESTLGGEGPSYEAIARYPLR